jgi:capsular polysaccharide biosynthesis protein
LDSTSDAGFYLRVLRRGWRPVLVWLLLGLLGGAVVFVTAPRTYAATASVLVTDTGASQTTAVGERTTGGDVNLDTEAQLLKSADVVDRVLDAVGDSFDASTISTHVTVQVPANTTVLDITFTANSPERAQRGAEAFATAYLANRKETARESLAHLASSYETQLQAAQREQVQLRTELDNERGGDLAPGLQARLQTVSARIATLAEGLVTSQSTVVTPGRVINQPILPTHPASPNRTVLLGSGAALGLLAGLGISMYRERTRPRLDDEDDVQRELRVPGLCEVRGSATGLVPLVATPQSPQSLSFGQLRRRLDLLHDDQSAVRRIVVAPVSSDAAALHTAFNLAWQYAHAGVAARLVIDGGDPPPGITMRAVGEGTRLLRGHYQANGVLRTAATLEVFDLGGQAESATRVPEPENGVIVVCLRQTSPLVELVTSPGDVAVLLVQRRRDRAPAARQALKTLTAGGAIHVVGVVLHDPYPPATRWTSTVAPASENPGDEPDPIAADPPAPGADPEESRDPEDAEPGVPATAGNAVPVHDPDRDARPSPLWSPAALAGRHTMASRAIHRGWARNRSQPS